jgi:TolB-like protein
MLDDGMMISWRCMMSDRSPATIYRFAEFELDTGRFELRRVGQVVPVEPQVLSLLTMLVARADALVTKDELNEEIWGRRFVSDAAIASRVKLARKALGDDGDRQELIRTVHGRGFRFVAPVTTSVTVTPAAESATTGDETHGRGGRPSIAILPFRFVGDPGSLGFLAEALADELIADLSRLRWLMVIARGSSFRFSSDPVDPVEVGRQLGVRYCLRGVLRRHGGAIEVTCELLATADGEVVWAQRYTAGPDEIDPVCAEIAVAIVGNVDVRIAQEEARLARRKPPSSLDAWEAYHLGFDLMYRFNEADNRFAAARFEQALAIDPDFARALGGLSFTRFQDAFMRYSGDPAVAAAHARGFAEQACGMDRLDPFAQLNLGRACWLDDRIPESLAILEHAIDLSPSYAQAIYSKAWAEVTQCEADRSDADAVAALALSPLDPLRYAFFGVRSLSATIRGDYGRAAEFGDRAARLPGAHKHIAVIAAIGAELAGQHERASEWIGRALREDSAYTAADFLRRFPFAEAGARATIERTLRALRL